MLCVPTHTLPLPGAWTTYFGNKGDHTLRWATAAVRVLCEQRDFLSMSASGQSVVRTGIARDGPLWKKVRSTNAKCTVGKSLDAQLFKQTNVSCIRAHHT